MTPDRLRTFTRKNLEDLAQRKGIPRRHQMRKEELIDALMAAVPRQRSAARSTPSLSKTKPESKARPEKQSTATKSSKPKEQPRSTVSPSATPASQPAAKTRLKRHPVNRTFGAHSGAADHLQLVAIDDHWGLATWAVSPVLVARAASALGADWHGAVPVLRVLESVEEEGNPTTIHREDLVIQGSEQAWFFRLSGPQTPNQVQLGYLTARGAFHPLLRSRPLRSKPTPIHEGWEPATVGSTIKPRPKDSVLTLQPKRLTPFLTGKSSDSSQFPLQVRAEVILSGQTLPQSRLRVLGELVELSQDGQFSVRFPLPVGRHILPAVATTPDGLEERTVVFAVEATSRELEVRNCDEFPL